MKSFPDQIDIPTTFLNEIIKTISIQFNGNALFTKPKVKRLRYNSIGKYISDKEWSDDLIVLNNILMESYIPLFLWIILMLFSMGFASFALIPYQKRKTKKAALKLRNFINSKNEGFIKKGIPIQYSIPFPSKENVIIEVFIFDNSK